MGYASEGEERLLKHESPTPGDVGLLVWTSTMTFHSAQIAPLILWGTEQEALVVPDQGSRVVEDYQGHGS